MCQTDTPALPCGALTSLHHHEHADEAGERSPAKLTVRQRMNVIKQAPPQNPPQPGPALRRTSSLVPAVRRTTSLARSGGGGPFEQPAIMLGGVRLTPMLGLVFLLGLALAFCLQQASR